MEEILIIVVCLVINALFSCFEMAFVTVGKPELRKLSKAGNRSARLLLRLRRDPERTLSVVQVGITLVGIISAAAGGAGAEEAFAPYFERTYGFSENIAEAIAIFIVVFPLTFLNVIFGELIPKAVALRNPTQVTLFGVRGIMVVDRVFAPIVWMLEKVTKAFLKLLPKNSASDHVDQVASVDIDHLSRQTQQYVMNLVSIEQRKVVDVMVEWEKVERVEVTDDRNAVVAVVIGSGHTRLPVVEKNRVVGLLHTKEFIAQLSAGAGAGDHDWKSMIRPMIEVEPASAALKALREMQVKKSHMAVVSQSGAPLGIVTFEDVLEEIVGEFYDEDDDGKVKRLLMSRVQLRARK